MGSAGGEALSADRTPTGDRPGEPWRRLAALAIDVATVTTVLWTLVVLHVLWFMDDWSDRLQPWVWGRGFVATVTFAVLAAAYETVFVAANRGQTPGKDIMHLRVVPASGSDRLVAPARALVRGLPLAAIAFVRPVWLLVTVTVVLAALLWVPGRRSLPDRLASTVVVSYDRDAQDLTARRPSSRRRRIADERSRAEATAARARHDDLTRESAP